MVLTIRITEAARRKEGEESPEPLIREAEEIKTEPREEWFYGITTKKIEVESLEDIFERLETTNQIIVSESEYPEFDYWVEIFNGYVQ